MAIKDCHFCRKAIRGKYWQYANGKRICSQCRSTLPKCAACGIAVQRSLRQQGRTYCKTCTSKAKRCYFCRSHLFAKYLKIAGHCVCMRCNKVLPHCVRCQKPMQDYLAIDGKKLCVTCSYQIEHCATCQLPLLKTYYTFPNDPRKFCSSCADKRNRCDICTLPLTRKTHRLRDKRTICAMCMKAAVKTPAMANKALQQVLKYLQSEFRWQVRMETSLEIVDSRTLARLRKDLKGYGHRDQRALGLFKRHGNEFTVYVESFLPYPLCLAVIAHEYTHVWQADHFPKNAGLLLVEGLAEWIAYHALCYYKHNKQAKTIGKQRDVYGQGFRKIMAIEKKQGKKQVIPQVLKMLQRKRSNPK